MKRTQNKFRKGFTLIEMLGVLAIIAILISVIAVGVLSAINRAAVVATTANFKNIETAVVGFVALPASGGTVPLTEGPADPTIGGATGPIDTVTAAGVVALGALADDGSYTLNQVLYASGLLDRQLSWRIGRDGASQLDFATDQAFRISKNAFYVAGDAPGGANSAANAAIWPQVVRAEATIIDPTALVAGTGPVAANFGITGVDFWLDGTNGLQAARCAYVALPNVSLKNAKALSREVNGNFDDTEVQDWQERGRFIFAAPAAAGQAVTCYYYLAAF